MLLRVDIYLPQKFRAVPCRMRPVMLGGTCSVRTTFCNLAMKLAFSEYSRRHDVEKLMQKEDQSGRSVTHI